MMKLVIYFAIFVGKFAQALLRLFGFHGGTWPGELAITIFPQLPRVLLELQKNVIFVVGTNGKTTTVKLIETILVADGKKVRRNASGANLINGIVSTLLDDSNWQGDVSSEYFLFEVDEASLPLLLEHVRPSIVVILNLFRDQLDRYGEVDTIVEKWQRSLSKLSVDTTVIINGDDPQLAYLGENLITKVSYMGLDEKDLYLPKMQHATDSLYCPKCGRRLTFEGVYFSHLGKWSCGQCGFNHPTSQISHKDISSPLLGVYNEYNVMAAVLTARELQIPEDKISAGIAAFTPAFGRMEQISVDGRTIRILLSKNPTGYNESLRTVLDQKTQGALLLILNDRIPDGRDISWIWDVDFEAFIDPKKQVFVAGDRWADMALRLSYAGVQKDTLHMTDETEKAIRDAVESTPKGETLWILPTYSAMLEVRKILTGKKIL